MAGKNRELKLKLWKEGPRVCYLCNKKIHKKDASVDHVIPRSKGGTNDPSNLKLTHKWCNNFKADSIIAALGHF